MMDLTFGEQVKIILSRKGMTIKELAETIEARTGKKMSRQNLTQRLGRDNFQEQDMRMIAGILGCPFYLNILDEEYVVEKNSNNINTIQKKEEKPSLAIEVEEQKLTEIENPEIERDITVGELVDIHKSLDAADEALAEAKVEMEPAPELETSSFEAASVEEFEPEEIAEEESEPEEITYEESEAEETAYEESEPEEFYDDDEEYQPDDEEYQSDDEEYQSDEVEDILAEVDAIEQEEQERKKERESRGQKDTQEEREKKSRGWKSYLHFGKKKNVEEIVYEEPAEEVEEVVELEEQAEENKEAAELEDDVQYDASPDEEYDDAVYLDEDEDIDDDGMVEADDEDEEDLEVGDINPYTGREYETNSVRMHPKRIGYVQVYDRGEHKWTDMTEWAFLGYQERKKALLGKDYEPPIYLD